MDKMQNFVVGDIVTAPSPASSGTAIEVESNENFPNPSTFGAYNLVLWNKEGIPDTSNCEIVRVTSISVVNSTLTELTITRAQEGTTAKAITTSWRAYLSPTKKYFDDLKTYIDGLQLTKASGSDINTGTDDAKFVTSKAIADSFLGITKPRTQTVASETTHTIDTDSYDEYIITAQAEAFTVAAPTGTPVSGQTLIIRIKDNGTIRAITWNAAFRASSDLALPTATKASKTMYLGFKRNTTDSKWDLLAYLDNI